MGDEALSAGNLEAAVERLGHTCTPAADGVEAWELYRQDPPAVVIAPRTMPGLDGLELCRRIRASARTGYCYVILLTRSDEEGDILAATEAGADDCLATPLERHALHARLVVASRVAGVAARLAESEAQLETANERMVGEARRDPLTGLGNRLLLQEELIGLEARVERYGHAYCAALFDVDRFRPLNERAGHRAGDDVLCAVSKVVSRCRSGDSVYRYGGGELLLILPEQTLGQARVAVERMRQAVVDLALPHPDNEPAGVVTMSAGVAIRRPGPEKGMSVLRRAGVALSQAKAAGRNRVVVESAAAADVQPAQAMTPVAANPSTTAPSATR